MSHLTPEIIEAIRPEGTRKIVVNDGDGLLLNSKCTKSGSIGRSWLYRYSLRLKVSSENGKPYVAQRTIGLGKYPSRSIESARRLRDRMAELVQLGRDPREARFNGLAAQRVQKPRKVRFTVKYSIIRNGETVPVEKTFLGAPPFHSAALGFAHRKGRNWSYGQAAQFAQLMRDHITPRLGTVPVDEVSVIAVRRVLDPLWFHKDDGGRPDTASRVRALIEAVLEYSAFEGWRGDPPPPNPARWKGCLEHAYQCLPELREEKNHDAVDPHQAAEFIAQLRMYEGHAAKALEFLTMSSVRTGSIIQATWSQIDIAGRMWSIPRTKTDVPQWIFLTDPMLKVLEQVRPSVVSPDAPIFDIDRNSIYDICQKVAKQLGIKATPHGMRATFRTACGLAGKDPVLAEAQLSHSIGTEVARRYDRATIHKNLFRSRVPLIVWWCGVLEGNPIDDPETGDKATNVTELRRVA